MAELTREIIMSPQNMELLIGNLQCFNSNHNDQCLEEEYDSTNNVNFHMMNGSNFYHPSLAAHHPSFPNNIGIEAIPLAKSKTSKYHSNKRKRGCDEAEKPKEVVHVRAKRGQATDSHSLAERQRREKINEKLRSLQDLVPGCYKSMGMAVMLDVIINYVRSLQNQIEFLSMKLSAASMFIDFNSPEMDMTVGSMQQLQGTTGGEWSSLYEGVAPNLIYPSPTSIAWPL